MDPLQHTVDGDMARRFLDFLDPDHDAFLFAAGDDNEERAREARKDSKAAWVDHRHGCIGQLAWLNQQQAQAWGIFTTVQRMRGKRRLAKNVCVIRAVFHEWDTAAHRQALSCHHPWWSRRPASSMPTATSSPSSTTIGSSIPSIRSPPRTFTA